MTSDILAPINPARRKPRIALMGEFSAGKSTLANILMHDAHSLVQVTATQMPPVWYAQGDGPAMRIAMDGTEEPFDADDAVSIHTTRAIRKFVEADILDACDIIDMPGTSDPNITEDIWHSMLPLADAVLWCTPATQAWRQSEAGMWEEAPDRLFANSLLLVTRIDKILSGEDRRRLVSRVQREAGSTFRQILPVSLIAAQHADQDPGIWRTSGLEAVMTALQQIIEQLEPVLAGEMPKADADQLASIPVAPEKPAPHDTAPQPVPPAAAVVPDAAEEPDTDRIMPRRIAPKSGQRAANPRARRAASGSLI